MDLLTGNIRTLYFKFLSAAFGSALISCIYGMVDMAMVGQYQGPDGAAALAVVAPVWNIIYSLGLLTGLWAVSPGPAWMARTTALRYAEKIDPTYTSAMVVDGVVSARLGPFPLYVEYPSWTICLAQSERELEVLSPDGRLLGLELNDGLFPLRVERASWTYLDRVEPIT